MSEEQKIIEAEIERSEDSMEENPELKEKSKRRDWQIELALFLILGILIGVAAKTEASKRITMGFDDYKIKSEAESYNISQLEADLKKKFEEEAASVPAPEESTPNQEAGAPDSQEQNSTNK